MPDTAPPATTAPAGEPDADDVVVSSTPRPLPADDDPTEFVAKSPIFINGVRAYNQGDRVTADAVKKNKLQKFVEKV